MPTPAGGLGAAIVAGQLVAVGGESPTSVHRHRAVLRPEDEQVVEASAR